MYELYYAQGACSMTVHVILNLLNADFKLHKVDLSKGEQKTPEFLKINPRGAVAALKTPDGVITENAAIVLYLEEKHKTKLFFEGGYERALALQWFMFANSTMHPAYSKVVMVQRNGGSEEFIKTACDGVQVQWNEVERHLTQSGGPYMCGDQITPADIYLTVMANWQFIKHLPSFGPKTKALLKAVSAHPAYQKALQQEDVQYKAAA